MRRESDLKNKKLKIVDDCLYFCWQMGEIDDKEFVDAVNYLKYLDIKEGVAENVLRLP